MPYIVPGRREYLDQFLNQLKYQIESKGEITYCLYKICSNYLNQEDQKKNYETLSMIMSCLEDAKLEWYRQRIAPYEDMKIKDNGGIE